MNCEQIKEQVSIRTVLESFNLFPVRGNSKTAFYFAIDREEKTPSFCVDYNKNKAFDFGTGKSFDVVSIVQQINHCSVSDALKYLKTFATLIQPPKINHNILNKSYEILEVKKIEHLALIEYLKSRKVMEQSHLIKEIHYQINGRNYFGIGFYNNSGGIEIRNKYSKICLGAKDVTLIKTDKQESSEVCVFEGFFDYMTYHSLKKNVDINTDFLILNSTAMFFKVKNQLRCYKKINLFLDNDSNGKLLANKILENYENVEDCSMLYKDLSDLNEWVCTGRKPI